MITRGMFGKDDGRIQWYGVIATTNMSRESWAQEGWGEPGYCLAELRLLR
jgi:receptor-type tyrosine-protein phosphatase V